MRNEVLYSKRLAGFKDVTQKEDLWAAQAAKMNTTVAQLDHATTCASRHRQLQKSKQLTNQDGSVCARTVTFGCLSVLYALPSRIEST